jgi:hypothetical protein
MQTPGAVLAPLALALLLSACTHGARDAAPAPGDVFSDPAAFRGRVVEVEGTYLGWSAAECRFAGSARGVSLTRSDWVLRGEEHCLYVTGGAPEGLDPAAGAAAEQRVRVRGRVIDDGAGRMLLQQIEALPVGG